MSVWCPTQDAATLGLFPVLDCLLFKILARIKCSCLSWLRILCPLVLIGIEWSQQHLFLSLCCRVLQPLEQTGGYNDREDGQFFLFYKRTCNSSLEFDLLLILILFVVRAHPSWICEHVYPDREVATTGSYYLNRMVLSDLLQLHLVGSYPWIKIIVVIFHSHILLGRWLKFQQGGYHLKGQGLWCSIESRV